MNAKLWITIGVVLAVAGAGIAQVKGAGEKEGVAVTVYNGNYAVVREVRILDIAAGGMVKFTDVASRIDATTVHFKSITDDKAKLLEQNYQYDLVSADKLLRKYIDKPIEVFCPGKSYAGSLLSFDARQLVLREGAGGIVMVQRPDNVRDIRFKRLAEGLLTRPTLVWKVHTEKPGRHLAEVTYQTHGVNWHAEYVLVLNKDDTAADISGWVSVDNRSGKTYRDAKMKFIAGDVRRVQPQPVATPGPPRARAASQPQPAPMAEKAFFEYHMYTLPRPSTVADNETKQLEMFSPARGVKVEKKYLYNPLRRYRWYAGNRYTSRSHGVTSYKKVHVFIEFTNSKENKLGIPLPAGKVRVYKQDPDDKALEFVGEEKIDHTPKNENLSLQIGNAFDIVGERKQTHFSIDTRAHWIKEGIEIKLRNHKDAPVVVRVKEPMYRWVNWEILAESHKRVKAEEMDARNVAWDLTVKPFKKKGDDVVLTYTVKYTW